MAILKKNSTFFLFLSVLTIAVFFRFWKIETIPYGLNNDAAWEGLAAIEILKGNISNYLPYAAEGWRGEGISRLLTAFFMTLFGNNPVTIRLATDIFGVGLVIAVFFLIKRLFNEKLALLTSFFIAISGWHITFSKSGWRAVTVPFFTTLLFYFFFRGLESKKRIHFILSGVMLSLVSLYTYDAARIIPVFFITWLVFESLSKKSFLKNYGKQIFALFISAFIVSLPMLYYALNNWENFTSRSNFLFVGNEISKAENISPLINNIITSALLFNVSGNGNDFFIFEPLVDKLVSWLLPIGLIITIYFIIIKKDKKYFFMLIWLISSLVPGILSVPNGNRAIGVIPSIYFLAAVGLLYPAQFALKRIKNKIAAHVIYILIFLICASGAISTYHDYLGPNRRELAGFYPETLVITNYIKTVWNNYDIYITDNYPRELLTYYLYKEGKDAFTKNYTWLDNSESFLSLSKTNQNHGYAFFMFATPENEETAIELKRKFPNSKKFYLWYTNNNIARPASLVVLTKP
ncbi:MAG: glycosyltransferase family 39 protein [Patescibacteria group bacterium]